MAQEEAIKAPDTANTANTTNTTDTTDTTDLSTLVILLLKGVLYQDANAGLWNGLLTLQARVRDYILVLGLELLLDEAEGYAFLRARAVPDDTAPALPRLIARRQLSFPVSLILALLRKKMAEFDASGGDTRLVLNREAIVDLVRVFLPDSSNEARLVDQIDTHIKKIVELGFLRVLNTGTGSNAGPAAYEVRRILKAFVDAQWLAHFDTQLGIYQARLAASTGESADE